MAVPVMWRTQKQRYSLQAEVCPHCTNAVFPPRTVCPYCKQPMQAGRAEVQPVPAPTQGREFLYIMQIPAAAPVAIAADD